MANPDMTTAEAARVGEQLRDARLALGATLDEAADTLRINRRYLAALEEGRSRDLPGPAYALGFVRSYARLLGLDADDLARRYREAGAPGRGGDLVFPEPVPERGIPAGAAILVGAVIMVAAYAGWWRWSGSADRVVDTVPPPPARIEEAARGSRPAAPPGETAPVLPPAPGQASGGGAARGTPAATPAPGSPAAPPASAAAGGRIPAAGAAPSSAGAALPTPPVPPGTTPAAPAEAPSRITLRATEEAWVQVRDPRSGQTVMNRVLRPGETFAVPREGLVMTTGRAQGLEVVVDGQASGVLAGRVGVVRDIALDPDALRQPRPASSSGGAPQPAAR
ncbi:helix-turn-helix domain-containing protein [Muricoccus pecuniae]|uniref:Cytoskeleton protein RodZ n=1 Tax=Muricoccus pecuniae TaxID=693023 RepID=A0A840YHF2_9PROT|nr:helix-turn-helix domain-containing protein [Roseomonas pecuniae]MBB5693952.1 cytoskeleton protein RodZ [Roseomonas pecuniae]